MTTPQSFDDLGPDQRAVTTKRTLATLSHAIEHVAMAAGPDAIVISLFQHAPYFARRARTYGALGASGATVVAAFAGDGPAVDGVHTVRLGAGDPLIGEWSIVLVTPTVGAFVRAEDLVDFDPNATDLESGRRFAGAWGFDRLRAAQHAERLIDRLADELPNSVVDAVRRSIARAQQSPLTDRERGLGAAAGLLVGRLDATQRDLMTARAALASETERAIRDQLTGLLNREGLERWLGGVETDGLDMPPVGVILIDLDGFKPVNDERGHLVGDKILQGVAESLLETTRPGDIVVRWGGDEFVVLCPGADDDALVRMSERLIDAIGRVNVDGASVGASAGIKTCSHRPLPLQDADAALYEAKRSGGGRSVLATSI